MRETTWGPREVAFHTKKYGEYIEMNKGIWEGSSLEQGHTGTLTPDYLSAVVVPQADRAQTICLQL